MTISYPLALPAPQFSRIRFGGRSAVGVTKSPFTYASQVQASQGQILRAEVSYPPLERDDAEDVVGFLLALNNREGTFLMGDPVGRTARGTWAAASPVVNGAGQSGNALAIRGLADGATGKRGDWLQLGSGASTHLHKLTQDFTVSGSPTGYVTLDLWPRLRAAPADGDAITLASAKGLWRLDDAEAQWDIGIARIYGVSFNCIEALGL